MNIINEPDLKMPHDADIGDLHGVFDMCRAIISALDGMLDAEKEAGVEDPLINFTATMSYAVCLSCANFPGKPALGTISQLHDAMHNPKKYGYEPRNDILTAYKTRFTNSFNTQNPATDLEQQILDDYVKFFPSTPVYIGEYHHVGANQIEDLSIVFDLIEQIPLFLGISFFEFLVAYWKLGSERAFGMFGLGNDTKIDMPYYTRTYPIYCLEKTYPDLSQAVTHVYGGKGIDFAALC